MSKTDGQTMYRQKLDPNLKRESLATEVECIFYGERVVIPNSLRNKVLGLVHDGHIGVVRAKSLAHLGCQNA